MGVRYLQSVLKQTCSIDAIHKINLSELSNKTIVVDASIYIYKGVGEDSLVEHILIILSLFKKYKIHAIFVFDGPPPAQKSHIIQERHKRKKHAEELYHLAVIMGDGIEAKKMKRQSVRINETHIQITKELVLAWGYDYCVAAGEADEVCASLVLNGTAWACLTEDMDMFLYGCPRILRQLSNYNETVVLNDLQRILSDLEMDSVDEFRRIVVSTGLSEYSNDSKTADFITLRDALKTHTICNPDLMSDSYSISHVYIPPILGKANLNTPVSAQDVLYKNGIIIV